MKKDEKTMNTSEVQPIEDEILNQVDGGVLADASKKGHKTSGTKHRKRNLNYNPEKDKATVTTLPFTPGKEKVIKLSGGPLDSDSNDNSTALI